jgi:Tol biopolymer transport system component
MGEARPLPISGIGQFSNARWFPDGEQILFRGHGADGRSRSYVMRLPDGAPRELTRPGTWALSISPDGRQVAAIGDGQSISIWPVGEAGPGVPTPVPQSKPGDRPEAWHVDGRSLWVVRRGDVPTTVELVDVKTGKREVKMRLRPPDLVGVSSIEQFRITPAGDVYCYSYRQILSELYLVTGLR